MNHRCIPIMIEKPKDQRLCCYKNCPGYDRQIKRPAPFRTIYKCEECSLDNECDDGDKNGNMWFCYGEKTTGGNKILVNCHEAYHKAKFSKTRGMNQLPAASPIPSCAPAWPPAVTRLAQ